MKKWLFPLACSLASIIAFLLSGVAGVLGNGDGTGYGGIVIVLGGLIFYCVITLLWIPRASVFLTNDCM